jgi:hypothetical protein
MGFSGDFPELAEMGVLAHAAKIKNSGVIVIIAKVLIVKIVSLLEQSNLFLDNTCFGKYFAKSATYT